MDRFEVSSDGAWIGFNGGSAERYERNITGSGLYRDVFLMEKLQSLVDTLTLENVIIDNYLFGGAAVGKDGNESVVVFPGN